MKPWMLIAILAAVGVALWLVLRPRAAATTSNPLSDLIDSINIWRGHQVSTGGNTLPGSPYFGPDVNPSTGAYTGSL